MPLNLPTSADEVVNRMKTDIQRAIPESNPFLKNSVLAAIPTADGNSIFDFYVQLGLLSEVILPDKAVGVFLERWASIYQVTRLPATQSNGRLVIGGTLGTNVPVSTIFSSSDGLLYESQSSVIVNNINGSISSITRVGTTVTVVTVSDHTLASNIDVTIAGVDQSGYNGTFTITVVSADTFTYEVFTFPSTPGTGSGTFSTDAALVDVISEDFQNSTDGVNVNQESGAELSLQSPIVGLNTSGFVDVNEIGGGTDQETDAELNTRLLETIQNPVANFNVAAIVKVAKEVPGVTRVFVFEVTPNLGQVTIYFMRDNDENPIPSGSEVTTVKDQILTIKPANTNDDDVIVNAPNPIVTNFVFSSLSPNTVSMQGSITESLRQFFAEDTNVGIDVSQEAYIAAIQNTIDTETGDRVTEFTLTSPIGDISVPIGAIATLGTVTYP